MVFHNVDVDDEKEQRAPSLAYFGELDSESEKRNAWLENFARARDK